jgi:hypothetical protein
MTYIIIAGFSIFQEWFFELNQFDIYKKTMHFAPLSAK